MDYKETFAKRLITLRERKNITQQELADELGITRQSLSLYEKEERTINIELLAKIADFFNVSTDYLMGRTDTETLNEDIQTACKVTGLTENAIHKLKMVQYEDEVENVKVFDIMDALITSVSSCLLYDIKQMLIAKCEREIFKTETIKMYCKKHNLSFSEQEIEEKGEYIFRNPLNNGFLNDFFKWKEEYRKLLIIYYYKDFATDLDYKKFKISNKIMELIDDELETYLDDTIFTEDFYKKTKEDFQRLLADDISNNAEQDE